MKYPITPDGRYFIVKERLWRCTNPNLEPQILARLKSDLGRARSAVRQYKNDPVRLGQARRNVNAAKIALGERGPVWWDDGAPDYNRMHPENTPYAAFWDKVKTIDQR